MVSQAWRQESGPNVKPEQCQGAKDTWSGTGGAKSPRPTEARDNAEQQVPNPLQSRAIREDPSNTGLAIPFEVPSRKKRRAGE